jgi:hypothetical protein
MAIEKPGTLLLSLKEVIVGFNGLRQLAYNR